MRLPKNRNENIAVQELANETLIYDFVIDKAYCLNETLTVVYQHCDGMTTFEDLKCRYKYTDDLIYLALDELQKNNLIESAKIDHFAGMNRREVIKKVGLNTMFALPIIAGLAAPKAANAASGGLAVNQICTTSAECSQSAPNCVSTINGAGANDGTRCCVPNRNGVYSAGRTQALNGSTCGIPGCSNCQCALDYCNANAVPCCSGSFSRYSASSQNTFCVC